MVYEKGIQELSLLMLYFKLYNGKRRPSACSSAGAEPPSHVTRLYLVIRLLVPDLIEQTSLTKYHDISEASRLYSASRCARCIG